MKAYAKVNMFLKIMGKRPDGYHRIETLFQGISLHDTVEISKGDGGIQLVCEGPYSARLPQDSENLAWQAAELLSQRYPGRIPGVKIRIEKYIPVSAGLGGGSADAAAVLNGLNHIFSLGLGEGVLRSIAVKLGADVSFCLKPLTAIGHGIGDELEPVRPGIPLWIVLVKPPYGMAAKDVYERWRSEDEDARTGLAGLAGLTSLASRMRQGQLSSLLKGLREGNPELIWSNMMNDLEEPAYSLMSSLRHYEDWVTEEDAFASGVHSIGKKLLCGSGSTIAFWFAQEEAACMLELRLRESLRQYAGRNGGSVSKEGEPQIFLTRTLTAADLSEAYLN